MRIRRVRVWGLDLRSGRRPGLVGLAGHYRGTSLIRKHLPVRTYSSICLGPNGGPRGGGGFL